MQAKATTHKRTPFQPARVKLSIGSLDEPTLKPVHAQYNPKEIQLKRTVPWTEHKDYVEFTGTKPRSLSVELLFDGFEKHDSVQPQLDALEKLATVRSRDPRETKPALLRPHRCIVAWGDDMPALPCVIESVAVKYTMFGDGGTPLRAIATVELKEARSIDQQRRGKAAR